MPNYDNGRIPLDQLVYLGPEFYLAPGTAARWQWMVDTALAKYGVRLRPTSGWNGYRPLDVQRRYRDELGIMAAVPGYSSHGGTFNGRQCMAIDVNNWRDLAPWDEGLAWSRFVALCRVAGFTVDFVSPRELWHIGDFSPWATPSLASANVNPNTTNRPPEDDMYNADAEKRLMDRLDKIERTASPYKILSWGTGLVAVNPKNGKFWILPAGYSELLQHLGYAATPVRVDDSQLNFATGFLPSLIGGEGTGVSDISDADMVELKATIDASRVALSPDQLASLTAAVVDAVSKAAPGAAATAAVDALAGATFIVKAA